jgi:L,D-transpeptidase YcbB
MNLSTTKNKQKLFILFGLTVAFVIAALTWINDPYADAGASANDASVVKFTLFSNNEPDQQYASQSYQRLLQSIICQELDTTKVTSYFLTDNVRRYAYQSLIDFYKNRNCEPAWHSINGPLPQADSLLAILQSAPQEGLTYDYHLEELTQAKQELTENLAGTAWPDSVQLAKIARLDFLMTGSYLTYASHLLSGKADPDQFDITWRAEPRKRNLAPILQAAIAGDQLKSSLKSILPQIPQYELLKESLQHYQAIAAQGGWHRIPHNYTLKPGDKGERVALLRQRLRLTDDLPAPAESAGEELYDQNLEEAVKHFQHRNGLKADGIAGKITLSHLNIPVEKRIEQLRINLERLRWLPDSSDLHYVRVNIPAYKASVIENGQKVLDMKVVVGKEYASTPVFRDEIQYLEFSPTWTVPLSIARAEILPRIKQDSTYLQRKNYLVYESWTSDSTLLDPLQVDWDSIEPENFTYRLVKQPGPGNPLGQVKFMFPNDLAIYLHDTPAGHLFDKKTRAYSHGCVRVEKPVEFALHLLSDVPEVNQENIRDFMHQQEPIVVRLPQPVPIQLMYQTAFVDDRGILNFRKDVYGHDSLQIQAIQ